MAGYVKTSEADGLEVDAARCLVFDFKDGGPKSAFKTQVLTAATKNKTNNAKIGSLAYTYTETEDE